MQYKKDIVAGLKELEALKKSLMLSIGEFDEDGVTYNTDNIRKLETVLAQIHTLKWVLLPKKSKK